MPAFNYYDSEYRASVTAEMQEKAETDALATPAKGITQAISKELGRRWKLLSEIEKKVFILVVSGCLFCMESEYLTHSFEQKYEDLAKLDKQRHLVEMGQFKACLSSSSTPNLQSRASTPREQAPSRLALLSVPRSDGPDIVAYVGPPPGGMLFD
jgi:hypothetical protein